MKKKIFRIIFFSIFIILPFNYSFAQKWECKDYSDKVLTQEQLDEVLAVCNAEIENDKKDLIKKQGETRGVSSEIIKLDRKIKLSQVFINKKTIQLKKLSRSIGENKADVKNMDNDIRKLKNSLKTLIYKKYQYKNYTTVEALFSKKTISEFFQTVELMKFLERKIFDKVKVVKKKKKDLEFLLGELEERNALEKQLILEKKSEASKIQKNKNYKTDLLGILKKEVGTKKVLIGKKTKTRKSILARKFTVASGDKVTFGEAYNIINPYKGVLGMDPAFVLAILFQESGHKGKIGGNIGRCTYNQRNKYGNKKGGYTVMRNSQKSNFVKIMTGLKIPADKQKISCPIPRDGGYGGAMGPAQFMPNTWMMVRARAAKIIGKSPSQMSPFTNHDAFIASATLLKSNYYSKSCNNYANKYKHISSTRTLRERCAAAMYYAGGYWYKYRMTYGQSVVNRANRFRRDIQSL